MKEISGLWSKPPARAARVRLKMRRVRVGRAHHNVKSVTGRPGREIRVVAYVAVGRAAPVVGSATRQRLVPEWLVEGNRRVRARGERIALSQQIAKLRQVNLIR